MTMTSQERSARAEERVHSARRVAAARATELFDTPAEPAFDALNRLAATLLDVPVSFLSLIDEQRDFYKSQHGFPEPLSTARELTGRSFCHHALTTPEPLVIDDTHADAVWREVPTVDSLGVRSYIGVPLVVDGEPVGSFCVIHRKPRVWKPTEVETVVQLAQSAEREIRLRSALRQEQAKTERANELARIHEELLAVVAHDLRTPLQVIGLSAACLRRLSVALGAPHVQRIEGAVASMTHMVDELLAAHAAESEGRLLASVLPCAKLLADAAETMTVVAERANVALSVGPVCDDWVSVDYGQLLRVLCNLIGNCIKYCPAGSAVSLSATASGDWVAIQVADDGPGMSAEDQSHAFEKGWQGSTARGGLGLGLSIVRSLVEQHQGRVQLTSALGTGTQVQLELPAYRP